MADSGPSLRLDQRLVAEGLAESRARAQALISAGVVMVDGHVERRAATRASGSLSVAHDPCPWVSRAALKLVRALDHFGLTPAGAALDVGASTGGFTEVLLARGASRVWALDVGHGQLHQTIASDFRVTVLEGVNARAIPDGAVPAVDWITCDVSFISLEKALPMPLSLAKPGAWLVALIKPQFEAGRAALGKGGVVRDPLIHAAVTARIQDWLAGLCWTVHGITHSPITGHDGNREFLIAAQAPHR